jgi:hypothetical protein
LKGKKINDVNFVFAFFDFWTIKYVFLGLSPTQLFELMANVSIGCEGNVNQKKDVIVSNLYVWR